MINANISLICIINTRETSFDYGFDDVFCLSFHDFRFRSQRRNARRYSKDTTKRSSVPFDDQCVRAFNQLHYNYTLCTSLAFPVTR